MEDGVYRIRVVNENEWQCLECGQVDTRDVSFVSNFGFRGSSPDGRCDIDWKACARHIFVDHIRKSTRRVGHQEGKKQREQVEVDSDNEFQLSQVRQLEFPARLIQLSDVNSDSGQSILLPRRRELLHEV